VAVGSVEILPRACVTTSSACPACAFLSFKGDSDSLKEFVLSVEFVTDEIELHHYPGPYDDKDYYDAT